MAPTALVQRTDALGLCERLIGAPAEGGLALFEGSAGSGKSALIDAACAMGTARGLNVLRATGSEFERDFAYGVVRQLFDPLLAGRSRRRSPQSRPARVAAAALGLAPESGETDHAVRHALLRILTEHAGETPILLAIDDLELVDSQSLDFLRYVAQRQAQHRIVAVAALNQGNGGAG